MKYIKDNRVRVVAVLNPDGTENLSEAAQLLINKIGVVVHSYTIQRYAQPSYPEYVVKLDGIVAHLSFVDGELQAAS